MASQRLESNTKPTNNNKSIQDKRHQRMDDVSNEDSEGTPITAVAKENHEKQ